MLSVKSKFDSLPFDGFLSFLTNDAFQDKLNYLRITCLFESAHFVEEF